MRHELRITHPGLGDQLVAWKTDEEVANGEVLTDDEITEAQAREIFKSIVETEELPIFDCSIVGEPVQIERIWSPSLTNIIAVRPISGGI
jgi:hypothetical protein